MSEETNISKSKQKREQRAQEAKEAKAKKNLESITSWVVGIILGLVVLGVIGAGIWTSVINSDAPVEAISDFSAGLTEEGFIEGAKLSKVDTSFLEKIVVPYSEVEYTADEVEEAFANYASNLAYFSDDASLTVEDGSDINLDYTGYVDGVAFENGSTEGNGSTLTIGSHSLIDDFEEQLIGSHPGDAVTVEVTFPEVYNNSPDLAGKDATFECTVNSIKVTPELTDALVAENFSDVATTVDGLKTYISETGYKNNVVNYLSSYINTNASSKGAPKSYINTLQGVRRYSDESMYTYYNTLYSYYGITGFSTFNEFTGKTDEEYAAFLKETATQTAAAGVTLEAYFKEKNLTLTDADLAETIEFYGDDAETTYGLPFLKQESMKTVVLYHLADIVTVEGK